MTADTDKPEVLSLTLLGAEGWLTEVTSNTNNSLTALKNYLKPMHIATT